MKNKIKILLIINGLFLVLLLVGCIGSPTDKTQIMQVADNIEKAIEKKDVDIFMDNVSYNYSDPNGGTFDNHINNLPEEIFLKIEEAEDLVDFFSVFKIEPEVIIPESELVIADIYSTGKMTIQITLKACIFFGAICKDLYNENIEYNVDFIKEDEEWKIISLVEI